MRTVDITPTWKQILPAIRAVIEHSSNPDAKEEMWAELARCANAADLWIEHTETELSHPANLTGDE